MSERLTPILKLVSLGLGLLVVYQGYQLVSRDDALAGLQDGSAAGLGPSADPATDEQEAASSEARDPGSPSGMPAEVQERIEKIRESEIFGARPKPPPIALFGTVGSGAFMRGPNGQTAYAKEGETLGGMKVLRVGVNRVLVEHEGETRELTIFSGLGGSTLLPDRKE